MNEGNGKILNMSRVRRWMDANQPVSVEKASKELGISEHTARYARDLYFLENETDLSDKEVVEIYKAVPLIARNKIKQAQKILQPLMDNRFGGPRGAGGPLATRDLQQEKMMGAITSLTDGTGWMGELPIPYVSKRERRAVLKELDDAIRAIKDLKHTIELGGSHNDQHE